MAKRDYFKIIYVILTEIFACREQGCRVNPADIGWERFGISEGYLMSILSDLLSEGYITGIRLDRKSVV